MLYVRKLYKAPKIVQFMEAAPAQAPLTSNRDDALLRVEVRNHRIVEEVGRDFEDHLVQPLVGEGRTVKTRRICTLGRVGIV